ncbi:MAG: DJ-1/PfpI family protein [Thermodesulfobacteriota bacterium]|nr:MAG: DJ-1/PfpI family protein [Thermodesulfobacteriota bacterium]
MKRILLPLAPGFEEIEALVVVDILRRAGAEVVTAGTIEGAVEGRSGIRVLPDKTLDEAMVEDFDMIVLPGGGPGTKNLKKDARIKGLVEGILAKKGLIAAICAATTVLSAIGITEGRRVTAHPGVWDKLTKEVLSRERVVVDGNIITSQGPGTALEFAFKLVELLFGPARAEEVNKGVLARL